MKKPYKERKYRKMFFPSNEDNIVLVVIVPKADEPECYGRKKKWFFSRRC